jgi:hypothetical protein
MNIYKINTINKNDGYEVLYDLLKDLGKFSIYLSNIVLLSEKELTEIEDIINKNDKLLLSAVKSVEQEIDNKFVIDWIKEEQFKERSIKAQQDLQERIDAMSGIISTAEKIYKKNGGVENNVEKEKSNKSVKK